MAPWGSNGNKPIVRCAKIPHFFMKLRDLGGTIKPLNQARSYESFDDISG
jgi:hypothetical protein